MKGFTGGIPTHLSPSRRRSTQRQDKSDDLVGGELNSASNANYDPVDHLTTQRVNLIEGAADGKPLKSADLQTLCPAHPAMPDSQNAVSTMTPSGRSRPTCSRFRDSSDSLLSVAPPRFRRTISANRVHLPHNPILLRRQEALRQTNSAPANRHRQIL